MNGPTLNPSYNECLRSWNAQGFTTLPQCEDCECDLTGKPVVEMLGWYCEKCAENLRRFSGPSEDYYQREERRQMGICA